MNQIVTMSSLRLDPDRKSVPMDAAKFLIEANELGRKLSASQQDTGETFEHLHLIGDASVFAVEIVNTSADIRTAIQRLRAALLDDKREDIEGQLDTVVNERAKLICSIVQTVRRDIQVASALEFLRKNKELASQLLNELTRVFSSTVSAEVIDIAEMQRMSKETKGSNVQQPNFTSLWHLALSTLPLRLRSLPKADQIKQSFYAGMEGFLAGCLIEKGSHYLSYKGPSMKDQPTTIIENMKLLVQAVVYFTLLDDKRTQRLEQSFVIDPIMDGIGFSDETVPIKCDPHTSDLSSVVQKLPLLVYENGAFRAVQVEEFRNAAKTGTGGVSGSKRHAWVHNLGVLTAYLDVDSSMWPERVREVMVKYNISETELKTWLCEARKYVEKAREDKSQRRLDPLIPGGELEFTSELISVMAGEIESRMYNGDDAEAN